MNDWFDIIGKGNELSANAVEELRDNGFAIIHGLLARTDLDRLATAYDVAMESANPDDVAIGRTTIRISDFINRGAEFDKIYLYQPILEACFHIIGQPFKLSTLLARTLKPQTPAQALHVDFARDAQGYPMIGFILMIDDFRSDNGATHLLPGSHKWSDPPDELVKGCVSNHKNQVTACGTAGSMIVYNGSVWHGHSANSTEKPRRSIQGAFIRREARSGENFHTRMKPETLARISPLARYLLDI